MLPFIQKKALAKAKKAISEIAMREGVSEDHVRESITEAILAGMANPDPKVQGLWSGIPRKGEVPTPEEFIAWASIRVSTQLGS